MAADADPPDNSLDSKHHGEVGEQVGHEAQEHGGGQKQASYSDKLKTNVRFDQRLKRNVLEITLEKTYVEAEIEVEQEAVAKVCKTLGIDIHGQVQGFQVQHKGRTSIISIWMVAGVNLERFCKDINIKLSEGVMTSMIRPAGKKDVTVTVSGLDFNTPDSFVTDYLNKFGEVMTNNMIYSKFDKGPFAGKFNGDRKYQVDFSKASRCMGTYHLIDGNKVRVFYRGNKKSCGKCHKFMNECPAQDTAKNCPLDRVLLSDHMKYLWEEISFVPIAFELEEEEKIEDVHQQAMKDTTISDHRFPPSMNRAEPSERDVELINGVTIKNFPKELEDKEIIEFLLNHVPSEYDIKNIQINKGFKNISVLVENISPEQCKNIFDSIDFHETKETFFGVPLYCKPIRKMTPEKKQDIRVVEAKTPSPQKQVIPGLPVDALRKKKKKKKSKVMNSDNESPGFVFSDDPNSDNAASDDEFEDSKEYLSESNEPKTNPKSILSNEEHPNLISKTQCSKRHRTSPTSDKKINKKTKESQAQSPRN